MKTNCKRIFSLIITFALLMSFTTTTFAAVSTNYCAARSASYELVDKACKFTKIGTDKVTVVNKGNVTMWVYVNGCFCKTLYPNCEYTYATYSNSLRVQVYSVKQAYGTQQVIVKTTSGTITNR